MWIAVVATVTGAVAVAFSAYLVLHFALPAGEDKIQPKDLTQFALTIVAGIGGVVALVVAYRRQQGIEENLFVERFGAAASQLGHTDVAVRLAGVYAMAGVADEVSGPERQQCVDVLCGYLRLPYSPDLGMNHQIELQRKVAGREGVESAHKFLYRQNDKVVRQTIVRVVAAHLQKNARESWSDCDFDVQGAALEDADFGGAIFNGDVTSFIGAEFHGSLTSFKRAIFDGHGTFFTGATFGGVQTMFDGTMFNGGWTSFRWATFSAVETSFGDAIFTGNANPTDFYGATFKGRQTWFGGTKFKAMSTWLDHTTFSGNCSFEETEFGGDSTSFDHVTFSGDWASFNKTWFIGGKISFRQATFSAKETSFPLATFSAKETSFREATFPQGTVSFENIKKWRPAPKFDWDDDLPAAKRRPKPDNVLPEDWPPKMTD